MSYDLFAVAEAIHNQLTLRPSISLKSLALALGIDRHTINRALVARYKQPFRQLQAAALIERLTAMLRDQPTRSIKEISAEIGFQQARSLSRRVTRLTGKPPTIHRRP